MLQVFSCCLDASRRKENTWTASGCVHFVQGRADAYSGQCGAEGLYDALLRHFKEAPPSSDDMAQLSMLQQRHGGTHGIYDYACTTVFLCAQESMLESTTLKSTVLGSIASFNDLVPLHQLAGNVSGSPVATPRRTPSPRNSRAPPRGECPPPPTHCPYSVGDRHNHGKDADPT